MVMRSYNLTEELVSGQKVVDVLVRQIKSDNGIKRVGETRKHLYKIDFKVDDVYVSVFPDNIVEPILISDKDDKKVQQTKLRLESLLSLNLVEVG